MFLKMFFYFVLLSTLTSTATLGQGNREQIFLQASPSIGDPIPELVAFDENGNSFDLASLRGNYTVLVFGCLT